MRLPAEEGPSRVMHSVPFSTAPGQWQEFGVGLVLVEKDNGGMREAIAAIAKLVQDRLNAELASGQRPPVTRSALLQVLKWALAVIGPWLAAEVKRRIISAYDDDIFQPQHATQAVRSPNSALQAAPARPGRR